MGQVMGTSERPRLAILYPGDRTARDLSDPAASRFAHLFGEFAAVDVYAQPAVYHDDFADEVLSQLREVHGVLVWRNPIEGGRDRQTLDTMLREVSAAGVFVSAHPEVILQLGTKEVLLAARDLPFGGDTCKVANLAQLRAELRSRLSVGARVLKQPRGHSGIGVWRIEQLGSGQYALWHAERGAVEETVDFDGIVRRLAAYFDDGGYMIDQAWQPRIVEGMTRAYLVRDKGVGFGHQAVVALHPKVNNGDAPQPGPRLYSDADDPRFQYLRERLEDAWVHLLSERVGVKVEALPLLWDFDFLLGKRTGHAVERYVLCEINVSSVWPFPNSATAPLVDATREALVTVQKRSTKLC